MESCAWADPRARGGAGDGRRDGGPAARAAGIACWRTGRGRKLQRSTTGPGREPIPEPGDIRATDSERGEPPVLYLVQPPAGVREVLVPQAGIQPLGEANQLANGEALQGGRDIPIVARDRA
jgi:hypothetical protein